MNDLISMNDLIGMNDLIDPADRPNVIPAVKSKLGLEPIPLPKKIKFPIYAIFGNGVDSWEVEILHGKGRIENITTFTYKKKIIELKEEGRESRAYYYYEKARRQALRYLKPLKEQ